MDRVLFRFNEKTITNFLTVQLAILERAMIPQLRILWTI